MAAGVAAALLAFAGAAGSAREAEPAPEPPPEPQAAPEPFVPLTRYEENPELHEICACESTGSRYGIPRQFNADGTVLRGEINPQDVGMCQINEKYHLADSIALGYDIYTDEGNWGYAKHLHATQGSQPWSWSRHCWDWRLDYDG